MSTTEKDVSRLAKESHDKDFWLGYMLREKIGSDARYDRALAEALTTHEYFSNAVRRITNERELAKARNPDKCPLCLNGKAVTALVGRKPRKLAAKAISAKRTRKAA